MNDLDSALQQFDQATQEEQPETVTTEKPEIPEEVSNQLSELQEKVSESERFQSDFESFLESSQLEADKNEAVRVVKELMDQSGHVLSEARLEKMLLAEYQLNPIFKDAFDNRSDDGERAMKALNNVAKEFTKELDSMPNQKSTQDREAVLAAVRTVSYADPDPLKPPKPFSQMSDAEFRNFERTLNRR